MLNKSRVLGIIGLAAILITYKLLRRKYVAPPDLPIMKITDAHQAYSRLTAEYERVLTSVRNQRPVYQDNSAFTKIGPPIGSLRKDNKNGNRKPVKNILLWTAFYRSVNWFPKKLCEDEEDMCEVTTNQNDLLTSDAVVIHPIDLWALPKQRLPHQRWIYFVMEPPYLAMMDFEKYNGVFNWTATYRWDADIPFIYFNHTLLPEPLTDIEFKQTFAKIISRKSKLVAIMNGNCRPQSNRFDVVRELRRYIPVDFYGACGELYCPKNSPACNEIMYAYKFYLSFENSKCRNYMTEKVWVPLHWWHAVPIVLGAPEEDYARVMPPGSYIHIDGFQSIQKLAEYITLVGDNPDLYEKYHRWRRTHTKANGSKYCDLCKALNDDNLPIKTYTNFKGWYDQDICFPDYSELRLPLAALGVVIFSIILGVVIFCIRKRKCGGLKHTIASYTQYMQKRFPAVHN